MDRNIGLDFVRVTELAAIAASRWWGKGDKNAADHAAVCAMRSHFSNMNFKGVVVCFFKGVLYLLLRGFSFYEFDKMQISYRSILRSRVYGKYFYLKNVYLFQF